VFVLAGVITCGFKSDRNLFVINYRLFKNVWCANCLK
jgi:hypothetical protein